MPSSLNTSGFTSKKTTEFSNEGVLLIRSYNGSEQHLIGISLPNCTYRYDDHEEQQQLIWLVSLWLDGPATIVAMIMALIGCHFAIRFLAKANLQRELTATLYLLCACDSFLIGMVMIYHSIEATSILVTGTNWMWNQQGSATLLVVYITFLRFCAVWWPLKYARLRERTGDTVKSQQQNNTKTMADRGSSSLEEVEVSRKITAVSFSRTVSRRLQQQVILMKSSAKRTKLRKMLRHFTMPGLAIIFSAVTNVSVFLEFELAPCYAFSESQFSMYLNPTLKISTGYNAIRAVIHFCTQTIGPVFVIMLLTIVTEYKVYICLRTRRKLFESQQRRHSLIAVEELREKMSRYVAIFIAIKFLILRSLPTFFDVYEAFYGIESFGPVISVLVRLSDFGVVLNAATNSFCYFGRTRFFENRLRGRLQRRRQLRMIVRTGIDSLIPVTEDQTSSTAIKGNCSPAKRFRKKLMFRTKNIPAERRQLSYIDQLLMSNKHGPLPSRKLNHSNSTASESQIYTNAKQKKGFKNWTSLRNQDSLSNLHCFSLLKHITASDNHPGFAQNGIERGDQSPMSSPVSVSLMLTPPFAMKSGNYCWNGDTKSCQETDQKPT